MTVITGGVKPESLTKGLINNVAAYYKGQNGSRYV